MLAVATAQEGKQLREAGIKKPVLILGGVLEDEINEFNQYNLIPVVSDFYHLTLLKYLKIKKVHLKFDTGMHRLGFYEKDLKQILPKLENFSVEGVLTHFPSADIDEKYTNEQINQLKEVLKQLKQKGITPKYVHSQNSAGLMYSCDFCNAVRVGLVLYGEKPSSNFPLTLQNIMSIKARLISVKSIKKGDKVSYTGSFEAKEDMKIGIISFGYADGLPRVLSNKGKVLINGQFAKVLGNITMDMTIVDLTKIDAKVGDEVVIVGKQNNKEIRFEELAKLSNTISYEIMCGISKRVKRVEVKDEQ